ncbi:DUF724 domain-containing protein 3-like isoform X4 [Actinidia eriantha]|nr:DUF724 domain-containing protein 3-like isoform X4 [Actinidia eriantha]
MRFKRGTKVEVMSNKDAFVSWQCAKIISGNGHTYGVTSHCYPGSNGEVMMERIPRKAIRPCPPRDKALGRWVAGDIVEVLDHVSWKIAMVLKVLDRDHYSVRLLGVAQKLTVHKSNMRVRQSWQDNKWVVVGKASGSCDGLKSYKMPAPKCYHKTSFQMPQANTKIKLQGGDEHFAVWDNAGLQESHLVSSRILKRASPYCSSLLDAYAGKVQKIRAIDKEGTRQRFVPDPLQEKVDAVAYPQEILGEKYMHSSSNNRSNGSNEMEREKLSGLVQCSLARRSEPHDSDSDACSVGSCSINGDSPNKFPSHFVAGPCRDIDTRSSDAESCFGSGNQENCHFPPVEEVAASIHRLELHAYRCTLEALYTSGPLSWEQEAMLTNLRITLHISNDEHLTELKNLICAGTCILIT